MIYNIARVCWDNTKQSERQNGNIIVWRLKAYFIYVDNIDSEDSTNIIAFQQNFASLDGKDSSPPPSPPKKQIYVTKDILFSYTPILQNITH